MILDRMPFFTVKLQEKNILSPICFDTIADMYRVLSVKRIELLNRLHVAKALSIYGLAKLLERSYKNVHTDTKILEQYGLIVRYGDQITAHYVMIHVDVPLMQAA